MALAVGTVRRSALVIYFWSNFVVIVIVIVVLVFVGQIWTVVMIEVVGRLSGSRTTVRLRTVRLRKSTFGVDLDL